MAYDMNIQDVKQNQQEVVKPAKKERPPKVNAPGKPVRIALLVISALLIPVSLVFPLFILAQVAVAVGSLLLCLWKPAYFVLEWQMARKSMKTQSMHLVWMISCVGVFLHWMILNYSLLLQVRLLRYLLLQQVLHFLNLYIMHNLKGICF